MRAVKRIGVEAVTLVLIGCAIGLAGNAVRERGLDLGRQYFDLAPARRDGGKTATEAEEPEAGLMLPPGVTAVTLEEAVDYFNDSAYVPGTSDTRYVFVDARDDDSYVEGHIPGALQLDHYFKDRYLADVLPVVENVEVVIVYCNGGECEDSGLVCADLLGEGVPGDKLLLFTGGWEAWQQADLPVETGKY